MEEHGTVSPRLSQGGFSTTGVAGPPEPLWFHHCNREHTHVGGRTEQQLSIL